jgi:hypothetical protein
MRSLAYSAETSDQISAAFVSLLDNLNKASGPNFKGCDWQTTDRVEIERFLRDPLNGKPFCNRMMYGVLQGILQSRGRRVLGVLARIERSESCFESGSTIFNLPHTMPSKGS